MIKGDEIKNKEAIKGAIKQNIEKLRKQTANLKLDDIEIKEKEPTTKSHQKQSLIMSDFVKEHIKPTQLNKSLNSPDFAYFSKQPEIETLYSSDTDSTTSIDENYSDYEHEEQQEKEPKIKQTAFGKLYTFIDHSKTQSTNHYLNHGILLDPTFLTKIESTRMTLFSNKIAMAYKKISCKYIQFTQMEIYLESFIKSLRFNYHHSSFSLDEEWILCAVMIKSLCLTLLKTSGLDRCNELWIEIIGKGGFDTILFDILVKLFIE